MTVANNQRQRLAETFGLKVQHKGKIYCLFPTPEMMIKIPKKKIRELGISEMKAITIQGIANAFIKDQLGHRLQLAQNREEIAEILSGLYGIGRWTIDWVALRGLRQFDVIPATDVAVRNAFTWCLDAKERMSVEAVDAYYKKFYPLGGAITYRVLCAYTTWKIQQRVLV